MLDWFSLGLEVEEIKIIGRPKVGISRTFEWPQELPWSTRKKVFSKNVT